MIRFGLWMLAGRPHKRSTVLLVSSQGDLRLFVLVLMYIHLSTFLCCNKWYCFYSFNFQLFLAGVHESNCLACWPCFSCLFILAVLFLYCLEFSAICKDSFISPFKTVLFILFLVILQYLGLLLWCWIGVVRKDTLNLFPISGRKHQAVTVKNCLNGRFCFGRCSLLSWGNSPLFLVC